jgi:methionyl-tRNA formyltransferase
MAVAPLQALHAAGFDVALVVTNPDTRRGRGGSSSPTPVKAAAVELGLPVSHEVDDVLGVDADLGVVVAFGRLIRPHVLDVLPMVNLHFSLLPRWRGAAPVERAILAGDTETGVDVMAVDVTLDTGVIYAEARVGIGADTTADNLRGELVQVGTELLVDTLRNGIGDGRAQQGAPVYAAKLTAHDRALRWSEPAEVNNRIVRVGGAWTMWRDRRLKVWAAATLDQADLPAELRGAPPGTIGVVDHQVVVRCGRGGLVLVEVQPDGKGRQPGIAWRNGQQPQPGERFAS